MRYKERSLDLTAVGVLSFTIENFLVKVNVITVDGSVEGDCDHLRNLGRIDVARNPGAVRAAETVRKLALGQVTVGSSVRVLIDGASIFVRTVSTVRLFVTEKCLSNTLSIAALELSLCAHGLVSSQVRQGTTGL